MTGDVTIEVPMIYDMVRDEMRTVTQADIDRWRAIERAHAGFRNTLRLLLGDTELVRNVFWDEEAAFIKAAGQQLYDLRHGK